MGNVIHRGKGSFTFVENTIFFDHGLSAKAKGIYCQIRSLENNPEWVFTIKGFASLVRDGADAVSAGIKELESSGYIIRARKRSENGRFLKAEEATWITLDDPAMHAQIAAELKADPPPTWSSSRPLLHWPRRRTYPKKARSAPERENPYLEKPHLENRHL